MVMAVELTEAKNPSGIIFTQVIAGRHQNKRFGYVNFLGLVAVLNGPPINIAYS